MNFRQNGTGITGLEGLHYYPFGMLIEGLSVISPANDYTYNGKELNEDFGLNLYDYGARWYDATVGRWWSGDPLIEKTPRKSPYSYVSCNPMALFDPNGMEALGPIGADGLTNSQWIEASRPGGDRNSFERKSKEFKDYNKKEEEKKQQDKTNVTITVTDEVVGTGYVYADGQIGTDVYFAVNTYKMTVSYTDSEGEALTQDFEVLKYGVKYDANNDSYYYQGFGGGTSMEETTITNPTYDSHYTYGGFNLYKGGLYDLHPQHTSIGTIPDEKVGGRVNKGCIGVCGKGSAGWGGVTDMLFAAAGMDAQVGMKPSQKKKGLEEMLTKINLTIKINAFSIPPGTPTAINKQK